MTRARLGTLLVPLVLVALALSSGGRALQATSSGPLTPAEEIAEGRRLFKEETFGGNGRTCATCHVAALNFRLTPANVAQRFATLAQTFDPLFVAEPGINLNTLTVDSAVGFPAGDILTGSSATGQPVRAKVLASTSDTAYLVYGGILPAFGPGRPVSSGASTANVVSIVAGDLHQLESQAKLRGPSVSPDFPQGRALILENPDGFNQPHVFRKVPQLLNLHSSNGFGFDNNLSLEELIDRAIRQHFTRSMARRQGIDFRLPTPNEQLKLIVFMVSLSSVRDRQDGSLAFSLVHFVRTAAQRRGHQAFLNSSCSACHFDSILGGQGEDTLALATGVANLPQNGPAPGGDGLPPPPPVEPPFGSVRPVGVPGLFNVKNSGPFFHNASAATLEAAVRFYNTDSFRTSKDGSDIAPIEMTDAQVADILAFLGSLTDRFYSVEHNGLDVSRGGISQDDNSVDFGSRAVGEGAVTRTFVVRNLSPTDPIAFATPACQVRELAGNASSHFSAGCSQLSGVTLAPGETRSITASFAPSSEGEKRAILEILTGEPTGVDLLGQGLPGSNPTGVDHFDADTERTPPGWDLIRGGSFRNGGGQLRMTRCSGCVAPNGSLLVNAFPLPDRFDYRIRGIATADGNDSNDFALVFNFRDANNYYFASFNERKDKAGLFKMLGGVKYKLSSFPAATAPGGEGAALHSILVQKRGSRIKVFKGTTLYADVTNGHHRGGRAGVGSLNDSGRFDDFVVTPLP